MTDEENAGAPSGGTREAGAPDAARETVRVDAALAPLVPEFLQSRRALAREAGSALARGASEEVRRLAHRLGGGLRMYGFARAAETATALERAARAGDAAEAALRLRELEERLERVEVEYSPGENR